MNFNATLARKLVEAVFSKFPEDYRFGPVETLDCDPVSFPVIKRAITKVDNDAKIFYGISKLVIVSKNIGNYVIKIPFNGMYIETYDDEQESSVEWEDYSNADSPTGWNYCDAEWRKYRALKAAHLDCFVSKTYPFITIEGFKCFIQEMAIAKREYEDEREEEFSKKSYDKANRLNYEYDTYIDAEWLALCIDKFGVNKVIKFLKYATTIDEEIIQDLHAGNYGLRPNGTPCILDFASFSS